MAGIGKRGRFAKPPTFARPLGMRVLVGRAVPGGGATDFRALAEALLGAFRGTAPPVPRMRSILRSIPPLGSMRARDYHLPARP